jgi:subtilisin family serine protease
MNNQFTEYVVVCKPDADAKSLWNDIENTVSLSTVPDRPVQIADNRDAWSMMCNYWLTQQEADLLKTDTRVEDVAIPLKNLPDFLTLHSLQTGNFTKPLNVTNSSGSFVNWGLIRHSFDYNIYGTGTTTDQNYQYALDGTGVDVVIWDSGIEVNHPEFLDENGQTRVKTINWYQAAGVSGTMPPLFYTDINGHGTACAGIVAGKTFGWAKKSQIYVMNTVPLVAGRSIPFETAAFLIRQWHARKPVDPATGVKRPTVVNASFGQRLLMNQWTLVGGVYQGTPWTSNNWNIHWASKGINPTYQEVPLWSSESNNYIESMQSVGIIVCHSAGNSGYKASEISANPNDDSNNSITIQFTPNFSWYYMRGSSPYGSKTISVGALDTFPKNAVQDKKVDYSNAGSLVKVFGASGGVGNLASIMTAVSTVNEFGSWAQNYQGSAGPYKQVYFNGTSAACPEIAGMAALYMQAKPSATPTQVYDWFVNTASKSSMYSTGQSNDYTNPESQWGGDAGVAYQPIQGLAKIKNSSNQWQTVKNISVKNNANAWVNVTASWTKTDAGWIQTY